jgi:membrane protease YdiL (CAAX protease family)
MNNKRFAFSAFFMSCQLIIAILFMLLFNNITNVVQLFIINFLFYTLVFILPILFYIRRVFHLNPLVYLRIVKENSLKDILIGLLIGLFIVLIFLIKNHFTFAAINSEKLFALGCIALAGPMEEIPFRGFYLKIFKERFGFWQANILTSVLFASLHLNQIIAGEYIQIIMLFIISLWFGYISDKTKTIWAVIIIHSIYNISTLLF